jgi:hypothetical protein
MYVVSDDEQLLLAATYYGFPAVQLDDAARLPGGANVLLLLQHDLVSVGLRRMFREAKVLLATIGSFDPSPEAALYTQRLAMVTDYAAACARGRRWIEELRTETGRLTFFGPETGTPEGAEAPTHLVCSLAEQLNTDAWTTPTIKQGQWVGVGSYCEVSITTRPSAGARACFSLDGTIVAHGVLAARDPRFTEVGDARIRQAGRLRAELARRAPMTLRFEDGVLTRLTARGEDFTDDVAQVTNPDHGLRALELGIGTNQSVLPRVKWAINSQLNEGAGPVHIGLGEGITGAHMDFIVADAGHCFQ